MRRSWTAATVSVRDWLGLVAAFSNYVVEVGRVGFARVELHQNTLPRKIDSHIPDSVYFHEYRAKFAHAFVAIFTLGGDLDCFNDIVIGTFRIERVAGFGFVWSRWVHHSLNVRRGG